MLGQWDQSFYSFHKMYRYPCRVGPIRLGGVGVQSDDVAVVGDPHPPEGWDRRRRPDFLQSDVADVGLQTPARFQGIIP